MASSKSAVHSSWSEIAVAVSQKKKGPQLALEPLDGPGIAGYVPKP
jgi:hypothetical protein